MFLFTASFFAHNNLPVGVKPESRLYQRNTIHKSLDPFSVTSLWIPFSATSLWVPFQRQVSESLFNDIFFHPMVRFLTEWLLLESTILLSHDKGLKVNNKHNVWLYIQNVAELHIKHFSINHFDINHVQNFHFFHFKRDFSASCGQQKNATSSRFVNLSHCKQYKNKLFY